MKKENVNQDLYDGHHWTSEPSQIDSRGAKSPNFVLKTNRLLSVCFSGGGRKKVQCCGFGSERFRISWPPDPGPFSLILFTLRSFPNPSTILLLNLHQICVAIYFEYHSTNHQARKFLAKAVSPTVVCLFTL